MGDVKNMTVTIQLEPSEIVILQNMATLFIGIAEKDSTRIHLPPGIDEDAFIDALKTVLTKLYEAGRSLGDEMR